MRRQCYGVYRTWMQQPFCRTGPDGQQRWQRVMPPRQRWPCECGQSLFACGTARRHNSWNRHLVGSPYRSEPAAHVSGRPDKGWPPQGDAACTGESRATRTSWLNTNHKKASIAASPSARGKSFGRGAVVTAVLCQAIDLHQNRTRIGRRAKNSIERNEVVRE